MRILTVFLLVLLSACGGDGNSDDGVARLGSVELSEEALDFGPVEVGDQATLVVAAVNSGNAATRIELELASGPFEVLGGCGESLAPDEACELSIAFTPTNTGDASSILRVTGGDTSAAVVLTGSGAEPTAPVLTLSQTEIDLGTFLVGAETDTSITVTNTGNRASGELAIELMSDPGFSLGADDCDDGLAPGADCTITVQVVVSGRGTTEADLTVSAGGSQATTVLRVRGEVPAQLDAPAEIVVEGLRAGASRPVSFSVRNNGDYPAENLRVGVSSRALSEFEVDCVNLAPGEDCRVRAQWSAPRSGGPATEILSVYWDGGVVEVRLVAEVIGNGTFVVEGDRTVTLDEEQIGATRAFSFTVRNSDEQYDITFIRAEISLVRQGSLTINAAECAGTLAAGRSCTIHGEFEVLGGSQVATVQLVGTGVESPVMTVRASGPSVIVVEPASEIRFGTVTSRYVVKRRVTVRNTTNEDLNITAVPDHNGSFFIDDDPLDAVRGCNARLRPGGSCALDLALEGSRRNGAFDFPLTITSSVPFGSRNAVVILRFTGNVNR